MYKILLYSNDSVLDSLLNKASSAHFACKVARSEKDLQTQIKSFSPHVVLVSGKNSFVEEAIQTVRLLDFKIDEVGLIFMSQEYSIRLEQDCFINGADHYLLQQTPMNLFEPRLLNLCRKIEKIRFSQSQVGLPQVAAASYDLHISSDKKVISLENKVLDLSPIHHSLVLVFWNHADRLLTRDDLVQLVWKNQKISSRSIDAQISKLKKAVPYFERTIINMYGRGYLFSLQKKSAA